MSKRRKSKDASDPQAQKCYEWTFEWLDWNRKVSTLAECRKIVGKVARAYGISKPPVSSAPQTRRYSAYSEEEHTISLVPSHQNVAVTLHEAAHMVVHNCFRKAQDHGPTFLGIFLDLLDQYGVAPKAALYASARKAGLKWRRFTRRGRKQKALCRAQTGSGPSR